VGELTMPQVASETRRVECYHEAGHAAVMWALGIRAERVVVPFGEGGLPCVELGYSLLTRKEEAKATPHYSLAQRRLGNKLGRIRAGIRAVIYLAGSIAQARYSGRTVIDCLHDNTLDYRDASVVLRSWFARNVDREKAAADACDLACMLIDHCDPCWQAVISIADAVYVSGQLLFPEVDALCSAAFQCALPTQAAIRGAWPQSLELIRAGDWPPR
jgi:hypothetical protein